MYIWSYVSFAIFSLFSGTWGPPIIWSVSYLHARLYMTTCTQSLQRQRDGGLETIVGLPKRNRNFEEFLADFHFDEMLAMQKIWPYNPGMFFGFMNPMEK